MGGGVWPSVMEGWVGVKFMVKKRYVTLEIKSNNFYFESVPSTALTSDDLDTPRAPVQMLLTFVSTVV